MNIRLHQYLSRTGSFGSKNDVIGSIRGGRVKVANKVIINPEFIFDASKSRVYVDGAPIRQVKKRICIIINKPEGYLSSRLASNDIRLGKRSVFGLIERDASLSPEEVKSLFCVGRLDEDTSGLLVLTNDGKLGSRLTDPDEGIEKTYIAGLQRPISESETKLLERGVKIGLEENGKIEKYVTKGCLISFPSSDQKHIQLIITEGKKREIRRMIEAVGNEVVALTRVGIGSLNLSDLKLEKGKYVFADDRMIGLMVER